MNREKVAHELEQIRLANPDGLLVPEEALSWAERNPDSELHQQIEWDRDKAARLYQIEQVRHVIRVMVTTVSEDRVPQRFYVSLPSDREEGGGYRTLSSVMSDAQKRAELLASARQQMEFFTRRYRELDELAPVIEAMESVRTA